MSKKLTVERIALDIVIKTWKPVNKTHAEDFKELEDLRTSSEKLIKSLLEQIRDEIEMDYSSFSAIYNVFNKYLNEKGGK